jgi:hypothetical protein
MSASGSGSGKEQFNQNYNTVKKLNGTQEKAKDLAFGGGKPKQFVAFAKDHLVYEDPGNMEVQNKENFPTESEKVPKDKKLKLAR